jgi:hypothetical protein
LKDKFGRFFGRGPCDVSGQTGIDSSALPEPIRGETPQEIPDLKRVFFAFDSASLLDQAKEQLKANAQWLKANAGVHVQIEGHCDEHGTQDYNYALGQRRADTARNFLISEGVEKRFPHNVANIRTARFLITPETNLVEILQLPDQTLHLLGLAASVTTLEGDEKSTAHLRPPS